MRFKGQLLLPSEPGPGLRVDLEVAGHHLAVESEDGELGAWPLAAVRVRRLEGETFEMTLAGEDLHFIADDTIAFAYSGMPAIEQVTGFTRSRGRLRGLLSRLGPDSEKTAVKDLEIPSVTEQDPVPSAVSSVAEETPAGAPIEELPMLEEIGPEPEIRTWHQPDPVAAEIRAIEEAEADQDEVIDVTALDTEVGVLDDDPVTPAAPQELAWPQDVRAEPLAERYETEEEQIPSCPALTGEGLPCRSPILGPSGYCYNHDPGRAVEDGYQKALEARARLKRKGTARLTKVYSRLEKAMRQVERGELEPDVAVAMAQIARTMCAILDLDDEDPDSVAGDPSPQQ